MVKIHRGWYLVDVKIDGNDRKKKNEKEAELVTKPVSKIKRCDGKIALHAILHEQREAILAEEQSCIQAAVEAKRKETEVTQRLTAELSRHKTGEVKHALKDRLKSTQSPSNCNLNEVRSHLIEEKEASQADLLESWHQDKSIKKIRRAEDEERKRNLVNQQNHSVDNHRRLQQRRVEEKEQNCKIKRAMRKTQEENAKMKKKKENVILLKEEMAASLAAKDAWEKRYKEALKNENKTIARIVAEKEARQEKQLGIKTEFRAAREMAIDNVARMLLANVCKEKRKQGINDELYLEEQKSKWKESNRPMSKKQYIIAESFQEMVKLIIKYPNANKLLSYIELNFFL